MIEVLRLDHRSKRDARLSTHVALVSRAFGVSKIYYSGRQDPSLENSIKKITKNWGGSFKIEYIKNPLKLFQTKKTIIHLTMYGLPIQKKILEIRKQKNLLIVVGGSKVPIQYYKLSNFNISITNQPHSEVSSLSILLHEYFKGKELSINFKNAKLKIIPQEQGKKLKS